MPTPPPPEIPTHVDPATRAALLRRAYEGEIIGCAMYEQMIADPSYTNTEALQLLYDIERVTADALKPLVIRYAVPVTEDEAEREGRRIADTLAGGNHNAPIPPAPPPGPRAESPTVRRMKAEMAAKKTPNAA